MADSYPKISFRIPESLRDELKSLAEKQEVSVSRIIKEALINLVRQNQPVNPEQCSRRVSLPAGILDWVTSTLARQGRDFEPEDILVLTFRIKKRVKAQHEKD